jgi:hypothetical protein
MEIALGALPHPSRVPEQRLLSPEIWLRRRRHCETILEILPTPLGFSVSRLYIGEGASSGSYQGALTRRGRGQGPGRATLLCGALVALLRLLFGSLEALVNFWTFAFVSSNSENISCVTFLKHKNSRKQGTGTVASCQ